MYEDLHKKVTDTIINQLEKGVAPWNRPWTERVGDSRLPVNGVTRKNYNGVNNLLLWASCNEQGFMSNEWASFQQWKEKREFVRKGEKGTMIVFYDTIERPDKEKQGEMVKIPFIKASHVFNRAQLQSYVPEENPGETEALEHRIKPVEMFIKATGAEIEHGGNKACYFPVMDRIKMPFMKDFTDQTDCTAAEAYYSTLFHETTHWTGHYSRLNRGLDSKFGTQPYAKEELVAELGASYLAAEFRLEQVPVENHASYIQGWLTTLKNDKNFVISAASQASKATAYLHSLQAGPGVERG